MFDEIRDFTKLAISCAKIANHFYQPDRQPHTERSYRESLPALDALTYVSLEALTKNRAAVDYILQEAVPTQGAVDWLVSHGVTEIAKYTAGNSARVAIARRNGGHVLALRTLGKPDDYRTGRLAHAFDATKNRMETPLVLQPFDRTSVSYIGEGRFTTRYTVLLELLPVLPVLPNGIGSIDVSDGHAQYCEEKISGVPNFSEDEERMFESRKLTFVSLVKAAGFQISRVADIGILPDGTPVFVDPDVIRPGLVEPAEALQKLQYSMASLGLSYPYAWQDRGWHALNKLPCSFPIPRLLRPHKKGCWIHIQNLRIRSVLDNFNCRGDGCLKCFHHGTAGKGVCTFGNFFLKLSI